MGGAARRLRRAREPEASLPTPQPRGARGGLREGPQTHGDPSPVTKMSVPTAPSRRTSPAALPQRRSWCRVRDEGLATRWGRNSAAPGVVSAPLLPQILTYTCAHTNTHVQAHTRRHAHPGANADTEPSPQLGNTRFTGPTPPPLAPPLLRVPLSSPHPSVLSIHSFLGLRGSVQAAEIRCGWAVRSERAEGRAPGSGRRRGGEGAGPGHRRAALPALQLSSRPRLSTNALAPARGCRTPFSGDSRTPPGGARGLRPGIRRPEVRVQAVVPRPRIPHPRGALLVSGPRAWGKGGLGGTGDLGNPRNHLGPSSAFLGFV